MEIPAYIIGPFLALVVTLLIAFYLGLKHGIQQASITNGNRALISSITGLIVWLILLGVLAEYGFFAYWEFIPPRVAFSLIIPLIMMLSLSRTSTFNQIIQYIPVQWPVYLQSFRIWIEIILWRLFAEQIIPVQMTFEGYNFDILSGILALPIGYLLAKNSQKFKGLGLAYNVLGLGLVTTIVTIAILSFPTELRVFMEEPANRVVAYWPFIWLPGFVVGMAYFLHLVSIKQLLQKPDRQV